METIQAKNTEPRVEKSCAVLVKKAYQDHLKDFTKAKNFLDIDKSERNKFEEFLSDDYQELNQYEDFFDYVNQAGLCFDRVKGGREVYWRWQLSWGGPSDDFRLYDNGDLEYWYLDWGDGACVNVKDEIFQNIMENFKDLSQPCD